MAGPAGGGCGGRSLTYSELDRLSNQVARALLAQDVAPGDRVGVLAPKSAASVVGSFGALKAGACYVPLDPGAPAGRLSAIMRDSSIAVVLADSGRAPGAAALAGRVPQLRPAVLDGLGPGQCSVPSLAAALGMPTATIYNWIYRGWITARHVPGSKNWIITADATEMQRLRKRRASPAGFYS